METNTDALIVVTDEPLEVGPSLPAPKSIQFKPSEIRAEIKAKTGLKGRALNAEVQKAIAARQAEVDAAIGGMRRLGYNCTRFTHNEKTGNVTMAWTRPKAEKEVKLSKVEQELAETKAEMARLQALCEAQGIVIK